MSCAALSRSDSDASTESLHVAERTGRETIGAGEGVETVTGAGAGATHALASAIAMAPASVSLTT